MASARSKRSSQSMDLIRRNLVVALILNLSYAVFNMVKCAIMSNATKQSCEMRKILDDGNGIGHGLANVLSDTMGFGGNFNSTESMYSPVELMSPLLAGAFLIAFSVLLFLAFRRSSLALSSMISGCYFTVLFCLLLRVFATAPLKTSFEICDVSLGFITAAYSAVVCVLMVNKFEKSKKKRQARRKGPTQVWCSCSRSCFFNADLIQKTFLANFFE